MEKDTSKCRVVFLSNLAEKKDKFKNFSGIVLRIATFEHPPSVVNKYVDGKIVDRIGVDMKIVESLERALGFTSEFEEVKGKWGYHLSNGSWTGLVGNLLRKMILFYKN